MLLYTRLYATRTLKLLYRLTQKNPPFKICSRTRFNGAVGSQENGASAKITLNRMYKICPSWFMK